ncbi:enoyl-CoA hydratase/isomerase family protein [Pseudonocardia sp. GCM10023141]|uniref:enoyl-CoA hydratase/isomerase family protein n=1 Tax=Pseudonocardia sp. GCM10023141 TaxID=3252653 RepID=UPI0036130277
MTSYETVSVKKEGMTAVVTLDRPERLNAYNRQMMDELTTVWADLAKDGDVRSIVITGNGRAFCAGNDLRDPNPTRAEHWKVIGPEYQDPGTVLSPKGHRLFKPVITAINGVCAGGGFYFVNDADIVICSDRASFVEPHTSHGLTAGVEMQGLRWRIPVGWVMRMALMGKHERVQPATALQIGLVTEVVAHDDLLTRALEIADAVNKNSPMANLATVEAMWRGMDMTRSASLDFAYTMATYHNDMSPDLEEGNASFVEGREPNWERLGR